METSSENGFMDLGIAPKLLQILQGAGYTTPTPIQKQAIPTALEGKDVMGIAQTGTGKTLAFGVPMLQRLVQQKDGGGLVILPTRELAVQVEESLHKIGRPLGLKTAVLIGGEPMQKQLRVLRTQPHVLIATPGRLLDHLEQKSVKLNNVSILVLDEADRMLDMGFAPQITKILQQVPKTRQTMLFSATMPDAIVNIARTYMQLPVRIEVARPGTAAKQIEQELFFVSRDQKLALLKKILSDYRGSILVFTRTKHGAKKVARSVRGFGESSNEIHSNRSLSQRREALEGFKRGKYRVLIATDIAARGIDVTGIAVVINYDLPDNAEDYVHRIGRTGRAAMSGKAISFATPDQRRDVKDIERLIRMQLPVATKPELAHVEEIRDPRDDREFRTPYGRSPRPYAPRAHSFSRQPQKSFGTPSFSENKSNPARQPRDGSFTPSPKKRFGTFRQRPPSRPAKRY